MKLVNKLILIVLISTLVISTSVSLFYLGSISKQVKLIEIDRVKDKTKYHFSVIVSDMEDDFYNKFEKGVNQAKEEYNVEIEINKIDTTAIKELKYMDIAISSKVDGIIVQPEEEIEYKEYINKAIGKEIPVITVVSDVEDSDRYCFVGSDKYRLGYEAADMIVKETKAQANIATIIQSPRDEQRNGFQKVIDEYEGLEVVAAQKTSLSFLSGEYVTSKIIRQYPEVNVIYCTSLSDTLGAAQVIVDYNKVGDVKIFGTGINEAILEYIEKGVISGTVERNPYKIGYESVKKIYDIKEKGFKEKEIINTNIKVITIDNLSEYK